MLLGYIVCHPSITIKQTHACIPNTATISQQTHFCSGFHSLGVRAFSSKDILEAGKVLGIFATEILNVCDFQKGCCDCSDAETHCAGNDRALCG